MKKLSIKKQEEKLQTLINTVRSDIESCEFELVSDHFYFNEEEHEHNYESRCILVDKLHDLGFIKRKLVELVEDGL